MSLFYTYSDTVIEYSQIIEIIKVLELRKIEEWYLRGYFKALEPNGIKVREVERGIDALKEDGGDEIDSSTVEKLKEGFESLLKKIDEKND